MVVNVGGFWRVLLTARINGFAGMNMEHDIDKRRHTRIELYGHIADIADGTFVYGGILEDISLEGLKLTSLPTKFAIEGKKYCIVVSGGRDTTHFKLIVRPCWKRKTGAGMSMDVGFKVIDPSPAWESPCG